MISRPTGSPISGTIRQRSGKAAAEKGIEKDKNSPVEVDLGEFNVPAYQPTSNTTLRLQLELCGAAGHQASIV